MDEIENEKRSIQGLFDELVIDSRPLPWRDKYRATRTVSNELAKILLIA